MKHRTSSWLLRLRKIGRDAIDTTILIGRFLTNGVTKVGLQLLQFSGFVIRALPAAILIYLVLALITASRRNSIDIQPISVSEQLADSGYTSTVAAQRLADSIRRIVVRAGTSMEAPEISPPQFQAVGPPGPKLPEVTVREVGFQPEAIAAWLQNWLGLGHRVEVSGEIIESPQGLRLMVRLNERPVFDSTDVHYPRNDPHDLSREADALFESAARKLLELIAPFFVAAAIYPDDPVTSQGIAYRIIATTSISNRESRHIVARAQNLLGVVAEHQKDHDPNWSRNAKAEYRRAIEIDPSFILPYSHLAALLYDEGHCREARNQLEEVVKRDPNDAGPHLDLGDANFCVQEYNKAEQEYLRAVQIRQHDISRDPMSTPAHRQMAYALGALSEIHFRELKRDIAIREQDEALAVHRRSIELDQYDWIAHYDYVLTLARVARYIDAIPENEVERLRKEAPKELCALFGIRPNSELFGGTQYPGSDEYNAAVASLRKVDGLIIPPTPKENPALFNEKCSIEGSAQHAISSK
jgi:tetratricopeptide (TPR) repeat protein